jgi:outer membrane protein, heavy metal efflux system
MFRPCLAFTLSCLPMAVHAERFTLATAVTHALEHNPELAAARLSIEAARGRLLQSGRLPNPELGSEWRPNVRGREFSFGLGVVQPFPLTNRLRLEKSVSHAELEAAEAEVRAAERSLATAVRTLGVKLLSLQESRALKEKQIANSKELAGTAAQIAAKGEGSALEATLFELEAQQLSLDVLQLEIERAALVGEARPLLGVSESDAVEFIGSLPPVAVPRSASPDLGSRPDYQAAQARIEAARQGISLARANKWEDAGVGLGAEVERTEDAPEGLETDGIIGLKFSLPLPLWNKNEGRIKEAEAGFQRSAKEAEALASRVRAEASAALSEMTAARRLIDETTRVLLPKAREFEQKTATFYKQGQPGTLLADVLRSREKRLAIEQARLDALRSFHLARIRLDAAMGR